MGSSWCRVCSGSIEDSYRLYRVYLAWLNNVNHWHRVSALFRQLRGESIRLVTSRNPITSGSLDALGFESRFTRRYRRTIVLLRVWHYKTRSTVYN